MRNDLLTMRFIHEFASGKTLAAWKRAPYVLAPGGSFPEYIFRGLKKEAGSPDEFPGDSLSVLVPSIEHTPWDEFVMDFKDTITDMSSRFKHTGEPPISANSHSMILRVMTVQAALEHAAVCPWLASKTDLIQGIIAVQAEIMPEASMRIIEDYSPYTLAASMTLPNTPGPNVFIVNIKNPWSMNRIIHLDQDCESNEFRNEEKLGFTKMPAWIAVSFMAYLSMCDEHFVERKSIVPANRATKVQKTTAIKPWIDERLPHIILIDPCRVSEYRNTVPRGGTHASPRPHQRRGHWKTFSAERYRAARGRKIWIKPTWVGDTSWECDGQTYKVLLPTPEKTL